MAFGRSRPEGDPLLGKVFGECVLEELIGRGGMGSVYRATRKSDNRSVAIKILSPFMASDDALVARFNREARAASRIRHPNVVRVLGSALEDGIHFTILEFVDGDNLSELLKREGRLSLGRAVYIAAEVAQGLRVLHHEGIIHRDVKPSNILIGCDGSVKITDFGVARDASELQRLTATGDLLGTLGFAAPEQLNHSEVDLRADLYSLGATLHYMLSGVRPPVNPKTSMPPLGEEVPLVLRELVSQLLAPDPANRPADAASVAAALAPYSASPTSSRLKRHVLGLGLKITGGALAFWAGACAHSSHGPGYQPDAWSMVLPVSGSLLSTAALFASGVIIAFFAFLRRRDRIELGLRSILGSCFLAASLVVAYMAGSAIGTLTLEEAASALISLTPEVLFAEALGLAAMGLFIEMKRPALPLTRILGVGLVLLALGAATTASSAGSVIQAVDDLRKALAQNGWVWLSFLLAGLGMILAYRHRGSLSRLFLAPLAVFISLGLVYWASLGKGSPPLLDALAGPGGEIALAVLLAFGARATLDLRPGTFGDSQTSHEFDTGSTATPPAV